MTRWKLWAEVARARLRIATQLALPFDPKDRYNIAPQQKVPVIADFDGEPGFKLLQWGLVPAWSTDPSRGGFINARAETVAKKPAFREAFRNRRCLVPADGFYEWQTTPSGKQPYSIGLEEHAHFAFAGIWEGETFAILTTTPNALAAEVHNRMPVMLMPEQWAAWLEPESTQAELEALTRPRSEAGMQALPVAASVNRPQNDGPEVAEPIGPPLGHGPPPVQQGHQMPLFE